MSKDMADFTDEFGFIGHIDGDGKLEFGDGTQRTFSFWIFTYLSMGPEIAYALFKRIEAQLDMVILKSGEPKRHWDASEWPGRPGSMTVDNLMPILVSCVLWGHWREFYAIVWALVKRVGFLWNTHNIGGQKKSEYFLQRIKEGHFFSSKTWANFPVVDWIGIRGIAVILRGMAKEMGYRWLFWPILVVLDLHLLIQATFIVVNSYLFERPGKWNTTNDLNLFHEMMLCKELLDTPTSKLARLIYSDRNQAGDDKGRYTVPGPYSAWKSYFRHDGAPPLDEYGKDVLMKL